MSDPLSQYEDERLPTISYHDCWDQPIPGTNSFQKWRKLRVLGRGTYGTLRLVAGDNGSIRAVKEVSKVATPSVIRCRELQALVKLKQYPDLFVQFLGWWEDDESIYFAMEYIEQGDLLALVTRQTLSEEEGRVLAQQLVKGLEVMHRNLLCHRDLKPENILVVSSSPGPLRVKLADFGCAKFAVGTRLRTTVGTEGYIAPEVLIYDDGDTSIYTFKADLWSLGCVLYYSLTKKLPLSGYKAYMQYTTGVAPFPGHQLINKNISSVGIQFITELMTPDDEKRLSASQALLHTWLIGDGPIHKERNTTPVPPQSEQATPIPPVPRRPFTIPPAPTMELRQLMSGGHREWLDGPVPLLGTSVQPNDSTNSPSDISSQFDLFTPYDLSYPLKSGTSVDPIDISSSPSCRSPSPVFPVLEALVTPAPPWGRFSNTTKKKRRQDSYDEESGRPKKQKVPNEAFDQPEINVTHQQPISSKGRPGYYTCPETGAQVSAMTNRVTDPDWTQLKHNPPQLSPLRRAD